MNRLVIALILAVVSASALAEARMRKVRVYHISDFVKVLIAENECGLKNLNGKAALVQDIMGQHVKGCWYIDPTNKDNIRIDWNNPAKPGDFAVIESSKFEDMEI